MIEPTFEKIALMSERVQNGARWLDSFEDGWREELRSGPFKINIGDYCVLGSLEHRVWLHRETTNACGYEIACEAFNIGLTVSVNRGFLFDEDYTEFRTLQWLWEAEFSETPGIGFAAFRRAALA